MINKSDIQVINDIQGYISSTKDIQTIVEHTVNTWQEDRTESSKQSDTKLGKLAEDIFASYIKKNIKNLIYISYDDFRTDSFEKHAPFDGLVFNDTINLDILKEIISHINDEVTSNQWGKISDELKYKCYKNHIYIVEVKSTRVNARHLDDNEHIKLDALLEDDFLEYPKYLRIDKYNKIHNFYAYIDFCKKYRSFICHNDCLSKIKEEEKKNMRHIYIRIYINEKEQKAYIIGCISNKTFIQNAIIKKMSQRNKSEQALYIATSLKNGVHIDNMAKL